MVAIEAKDFPSFDSSAIAYLDSFDSLAVEEVHSAEVVMVVVAAVVVGDVVEVAEGNFDLKLK